MKISIFTILLSFLAIGKVNGQITSNELIGTWVHSGSETNYSYTYSYKFNQDGTGEKYSETNTFGSLPSGYSKTTSKFKWVITNGKVYGTAISTSTEENKDGTPKFNSLDLRQIAQKKDMNIRFTHFEKKGKCMRTSGLSLLINEDVDFCK